ncbi:HAMP domain-containing sensor histidine kinase [Neobacillus sp. SuZ13]|uniref:sensor histidine kinase n=1 Tax=Neobacillus sp. SuZ13 TaxID=3047875 RepID=UPI0024BFBDA5|nr:HAMP domain-containing sensor histidine kinase [Neobacillus sp. SuZ13]WHY67585.1 HAMP domain-containing sensor histidine kinase [Neobacillus sp. SuZ13]
MKAKRFFQHLFGIVFFIVFVSLGFTAGYFIVSRIYHLFHLQTSDYLRHMAEVVSSLLTMALAGFLISLLTNSRRHNLFHEVLDALSRIAKGDFNVYLDLNVGRENQFTKLIDHINHMAKQLKQLEDMRQEFISNVSHEIQSPLTSIMGFAQALQYDQLTNEERNHYLSIIETESRRLSKLSDNLLKLTSLESKHHPFDRHSYRLDQQIRTIILACEPLWLEKDLELDVSMEKVSIIADEDLMSQVWTNLFHNSIKFTPNQGMIRVELKKVDDKTVVKISDTGIGISKKDQIHVFERFYKADKARDRSKGGSGLGLSIVKKIIELHEGTILVESEEGKGTTFIITL